MTNLSDKFDTFEAQATAQHNALMARLADTNAKLDAMLVALGAPPPTATVTLADVVAAINANTAIVADIHLDTVSMDQKLLAMRIEQHDIHLDTISIDQKLLRIRDAIAPLGENFPAESRSSILWSLYRLVDAIEPSYPGEPYTPVKIVLNQIHQLLSQMKLSGDAISNVLGTPPPGPDFTFATLLQRIAARTGGTWESLGVLSSPAAGTALQLLACICDAEQKQLPVDPLDPTNLLSCNDPYISSGQKIAPLQVTNFSGNVLYATWAEPLPPTITYGSIVGLSFDEGTIQSTDWSAFSVFVQSTESQYSDDPLSAERYPTNTWRTLSGSGLKTFSVSERGSIKVYLCKHAAQTSCAPISDQPDSSWTDTGHQVFNPSSTPTIWSGSGTNRVKVGFNANAGGGATIEVLCDGTVIDTVQLTASYTWHAYSVGTGAVLTYRIINPNSHVDWYPAAIIAG